MSDSDLSVEAIQEEDEVAVVEGGDGEDSSDDDMAIHEEK